MVSEQYQFPKITPEMHKAMQKWYKKHNHGRCAKRSHGAIGGDITFEITPTSIGNFVDVKCVCGLCYSLIEP